MIDGHDKTTSDVNLNDLDEVMQYATNYKAKKTSAGLVEVLINGCGKNYHRSGEVWSVMTPTRPG